MYTAKGDEAKPEPLYLEAHDVLLRASENVVPFLSEAQALNWLDQNHPRTDLLLAFLSPNTKSSVAYQCIWQTKSLASRLRIVQRLDRDASPEAQDVFARLRDARSQLARLMSSTSAPDGAHSIRQQISEANERKESLEKRLASVSEASARTLSIRDATIGDLLSLLPDHAAVIDLVQLADIQPVQKTIETTPNGKIIKRVIRDNEAVPYYEAFVVRRRRSSTPQESVTWIPLGLAKTIDDIIAEWRSQIAEKRQSRSLASLSIAVGTNPKPMENPHSQIRTLVWEPLEKHLDGCHTVIILPDGALTRVPWGALPGKQPNSFLIEEYAIATASYGQQLYGLLSADPVSDGPLLVAGGIDYDHRKTLVPPPPSDTSLELQLASTARRRTAEHGSSAEKWGFLAGAKAESEKVAALWTSIHPQRAPQVLTGIDADEARLPELLAKSRYVHLATHGFFAPPGVKSLWQFDVQEAQLFGENRPGGRRATVTGRNPLLLSGIVVAGANLPPERDSLGLATGEDGILTAEELAGLNLYQSELVTLSACETGLGDVAAGEGVFGLQRALHQAGVRSVISSLWKVDDAATRALMTEFYRNLWEKKLSKLDALRQAQLAMLAGYRPETGTIRGLGKESVPAAAPDPANGRLSPYYWSAFQLSGDWR
jgi:CHAT domain-containing protein